MTPAWMLSPLREGNLPAPAACGALGRLLRLSESQMPHPSSGGGSCPPHRVVLINDVCEAPRLVRALLTPHPHSPSAADVCHPHKSPVAAGIVPDITGVHFSSKFVGDGTQQSQMSCPPCWTAGLLARSRELGEGGVAPPCALAAGMWVGVST